MDPDDGRSCCPESIWFNVLVCVVALFAAGGLFVAFWPLSLIVVLGVIVFAVGILVGIDFVARKVFDGL